MDDREIDTRIALKLQCGVVHGALSKGGGSTGEVLVQRDRDPGLQLREATLIVKAAGDAKDKQLSFMLAPRFTPRESPDY